MTSDTKAISLLSMSMLDDVFHPVCHLKTSKEIWDTLHIQYEGTDSLLGSRKINLVCRYEMFMSTIGKTLSLSGASEIELPADRLKDCRYCLF